MAIALLPSPKFTVHGKNGSLADGYLVYTYEIGTTTPKATYTDSGGGTPNSNPIVLNERGEADVWWNGYYKVVVTTPTGGSVWTVDNYGSPGLSGITDNSTVTQLTLTDTAATFTSDVVVGKDLIQKIGTDVASASLLTLGDGNMFDITGTTTITSIASKGVGSVVYLQFDGVVTLTHHATDLIIPGAADIITAAGDTVTLYEYASGDWRVLDSTALPIRKVHHITEKKIAATTTTTYEIDCENGTLFELDLGGNTAITFANVPTSGQAITLTLVLIQDATGNRVPSFPASVDWDRGITPTWGTAENDEDIITLFTYDGGTRWYANLVGQNYA